MLMRGEGVAFEDARRVRCVLLPVGGLSTALFARFAALLEGCAAAVALREVTRDPTDTSLLKHLDWKQAQVRFVFDRDLEDLDGQPSEGLRSELEEFQAHKKIVAVIGILHCPSTTNIAAAYDAFKASVKRKYVMALAHRCFALDSDALQSEQVVQGSNIVPVPACDEEKTKVYFETLMSEFTYALLREFETIFARKVEAPYLITPLDADLREREVKAVQIGRLSKLKGDYCLLAGSPEDALSFYLYAKEQCRSKSDWMWLAGSLEGYCCALLQLGRDETEAMANFTEAVLHYNKCKALTLEFEAQLKLARWKRGKGDTVEAASLLMTCSTLAKGFTATKDQVSALCAIAQEFRSMGFYRKYAFFCREVALLYEKLETMEGAREQILLRAAPFFQLRELGQREPLLPSRWNATPVHERADWLLIGALTVLQLAKVAGNLQEEERYALYITLAMRLFPKPVSAKTKADLAMLLQRNTQQLVPSIRLDMTGLPLVASINIIPAPSVVKRPPEGGGGGASGASVFIFNPRTRGDPNELSKMEEAVWVRGEVATVRVTVVNEHEFPLQLERMRLCVDHRASIEAYSASLTVPAKTTKVFDISCLPLQAGHVTITGVEIQTFHILAFHQVDLEGRGVGTQDAAVAAGGLNSNRPCMRINVIEPLPQMHVDSVLFNGNHLNILEGIHSEVVISMENTGSTPVRWIRLQVAENQSSKPGIYAERRAVFSWSGGQSPEYLLRAEQEPLLPGHTLPVTMELYGLLGTIGASFTVDYGGDVAGLHCRREVHHIPIFVRPALEVAAFDVHLCNFSADELPQPFRVRDVAPLRDRPLCLLVFQVSNSARNAFSLQASIDYGCGFVPLDAEKMICAPGSSQVFGLPLPRVWIPDAELVDIPRQGQFIRVRTEDLPTAEQAHAMKLVYNYKRFLQRIIRLVWTSTNNQSGSLSLHNVRVDLPIVRKILPAPLLLSFVDLPAEGVRSISHSVYELTVELGAMVEIGISITNNTSAVLRDRVFALALEDSESIQGDLVMWSGSLHSLRDHLEPGQAFCHHFKLCFLGAASYKFSIECKNDKDLNIYCVSPTLIVRCVSKKQ